MFYICFSFIENGFCFNKIIINFIIFSLSLLKKKFILKYYSPKINENFIDIFSFIKYVKISSINENGKDKKEHIISNLGYWFSSEDLL